MAKKKHHPIEQPAFQVPDREHSVKQACTTAAETGGGRPTQVSAAPAGAAKLNENGRVEAVMIALRRVTIEVPCAVAGEDRLGPRHLHAHLTQNARRALAALVRGLDVADECDRHNRRPKNTTPASVNFLLERLWEGIHGDQ